MSGSLSGGQKSGFLNSFLSFIREGVAETASTANTVKTPVLPKYMPEVKGVQMELPEKVDAVDNSDLLGDKIINGQRVSEDKIRNDSKVSGGNISADEKGLKMVCEPDSSCDVPELPPLHVNNFQGSFSNWKNLNDSQTDDNSKGYLSSARDDDYDSENSPSLTAKESGSRKLQQSSHRMRTRHKWNKGFDEGHSQESSSSSVDVQSKSEQASPIRRQSTRRAKQKAEQKRLANIKKGKRLLSLYTEVSDSDDSEEELDPPSAKSSENEAYDSDKDPAWTPVAHSSAKRSFGSDNEEEPIAKRRQGRPHSASKFTPQKTLTVASKCAPQTTTTMPKPSSDIPSIQKVTTAIPTTAPVAVSKKPLEEGLLPLYEGPPEADSPHSFQKGDFVIERKDLTNYESFPIWKIDSGRLLQKFEPVEKSGRRLHQSMSVYSSWVDQVHYRFKAIEVLVFSAQRGKEMVEVLEKYRPKPSECLNSDQIKEPFNIYVQILVSQSLEPTYLSALLNEKEKYYMDALNTIDEMISECLLKIKNTFNWKDEFQKSVDQLPSYELQDLLQNGLCQATRNSNCKAEKLLRLYGCIYHRNTLFVTEELEQVDAQEYEVGKETLESLPIYHGLQHFKMHLLKKCQVKVNEVKVDIEMEDNEVLDKCVLDQKWITGLLNSLLNLVRSANA